MNSYYDIINKKKNGINLSNDDIRYFINCFHNKKVKDYQMSAFLMAVCFNGLSSKELSQFIKSIVESGEKISLHNLKGPIIDKHSTGGVGDKVSLILAPLLAACGAHVPMIAGRGLGHTGGTIDKLESIPGYKTNLSIDTFKKIVSDVGASIISQTDSICPVDREMYKIRDVTATIDSFPLMASSILSKKIAEGLDSLVMDIKIGNGAFIKTQKEAEIFSKIINKICSNFKINSLCVITNMNQPLGNKSGLANEVDECIDIMKGKVTNETKEVTFFLAQKCLEIAGIQKNADDFEKLIDSGHLFEKFENIVASHGGSIKDFNKLNTPKYKQEISFNKSGYVSYYDTYKIGLALNHLGCGRSNFDSNLDHSAGLTMNYKLGEKYSRENPIFSLYSSDKDRLNSSKKILLESIKVANQKPVVDPLIYKVI